jgi:Alpha amylase, catalytic domain
MWPRHPKLYEINTWVWLFDLATKHGTSLDLSSVPAAEWDAIADLGFDAVWFMGVWERSPAGIAIANQNKSLLNDFQQALPDFRAEDNVGSPYCVRRYVVDPHLGGPEGLSTARRELAKRGMRLFLDFVPNHVAPDHPWVSEHPEYLIQGTTDDIRNDPSSFIQVHRTVFACGRDPYFPAWPDVIQVNAFEPTLRQAVVETLSDIADQCDGIRCDMAMLVLNSIFKRTWGDRAGSQPEAEYWVDVIRAVKKSHPSFFFIAEAYWGLEWELQQQGFDFCYDKRLYDRLDHDTAESVRLHLCGDLNYQEKLVRFLENHDEARAAAAFSPARERAFAVATYTLPGARLFHEGQLEGRKIRLPVFLGRRPHEPVDEDLLTFYRKLLAATHHPAFRDGHWKFCKLTGWLDNPSYQSVLAWTWGNGDDRYLIVTNLSDGAAQGHVATEWEDLGRDTLRLADVWSGADYERSGNELLSPGLYIDLAPWSYHFFHCTRAADEPRWAAAFVGS